MGNTRGGTIGLEGLVGLRVRTSEKEIVSDCVVRYLHVMLLNRPTTTGR